MEPASRAGVPLPGEVMIVHHEPRPDGSRQMSEVGFVVPAHATAHVGECSRGCDHPGALAVAPVLR